MARAAPAIPGPRPQDAAGPATRRAPAAPTVAVRELRTVRDCLRYACSRFGAAGIALGQGTDDPWDEAAWLVLWALHLPPDRLEPFLEARLTIRERRDVIELIERRCRERMPAAYLTGEAWLRGLRFRADARALVPRSLIAEALEETLPAWLDAQPPAAILDLCTGGGSLAVFAARSFPEARVDATDLSTDALALARENLTLHGLEDRIALFQGDLFGGLQTCRYDLILCNPPYVNATAMAALPPEFLAEPQGALGGGVDGMDLIRRILSEAPQWLTPQGQLLLEIGHEAAHFAAAFPQLEYAWLPVAAGEDLLVLVTRAQLIAASGRRG